MSIFRSKVARQFGLIVGPSVLLLLMVSTAGAQTAEAPVPAPDVRGGIVSGKGSTPLGESLVPKNFQSTTIPPKKQAQTTANSEVSTTNNQLPDSFAIPAGEAAELSELRKAVGGSIQSEQPASSDPAVERKLSRELSANKQVRNILETMEKVNNRVTNSNLGPGEQTNYLERVRRLSNQIDETLDPSIERRRKAESNRF